MRMICLLANVHANCIFTAIQAQTKFTYCISAPSVKEQVFLLQTEIQKQIFSIKIHS